MILLLIGLFAGSHRSPSAKSGIWTDSMSLGFSCAVRDRCWVGKCPGCMYTLKAGRSCESSTAPSLQGATAIPSFAWSALNSR